MNRKKFGIRFVCAVAVSFAACAAADAQQLAGGPFSGLFRGTPNEQPQKLDLSGSAFVAYDDNPLAQAPGGGGGVNAFGAPEGIKPGAASGLQASLAYGFHKSGTRSGISLAANGSIQEFESSAGTDPLVFQSYNAAASFRTSLTNKVSASFGGTAQYAPYYQYASFLKNTTNPDSPSGTDYGFAADSLWVRTTGATATIEDRITKRTGISGGVGWSLTDMPTESARIEQRSASMTISHSLTRKLSFHIGYGVQESRFVGGDQPIAPYRSASMDVGLGYGDGFTFRFGRNMVLSLNVGASLQKNGDPASVVATGKSTVFLVNGAATLSRSLTRTWSTSLSYTRGVTYMVGFTQPFNVDAASAGLGGQVVDRVFASFGVGASRGQQVFTTSGNLVAYTGSARLNFALFKNLALYAQASYYKYSIPNPVETFGFTPQMERRSVSAGLSTWIPLIKAPRGQRGTPDAQAGQQ